MNFEDFSNSLYNRVNSGKKLGHSAGLEFFLLKLVPAVEVFTMENAHLFQSRLGLSFISEKEPVGKICYLNNPEVRADYRFTFAPIDILDYVYAVLNSSSFQGKFKEFVERDFHWFPFPTNSEDFWKRAELGGKLRQIHLLEPPGPEQPVIRFPVNGDNRINKICYERLNSEQPISGEKITGYSGAVFINDLQYFAGVPVSAWELNIGEARPAQKWLNDRKGSKLSNDDIQVYIKIIVALSETIRLVNEKKF